MRIDLHSHSTCSDGVLSVGELFAAAKQVARGLNVFAITDHDTMHSYAVAQALPLDELPFVYLPGVEVSTEDEAGKEQHLLLYFPSLAKGSAQAFASAGVTAPPATREAEEARALFCEELAEVCRARIDRARTLLENVSEAQGVPLDWEEFCAINKINQETNTGDGVIGRPHVARYLVQKGLCGSTNDAFRVYLGDDSPLLVKKKCLKLNDVISGAGRMGAVAVLAHPCLRTTFAGVSPVLASATAAGMRGIEVYHNANNRTAIRSLAMYCRKMGLFQTAGSDFHSPHRDFLGSMTGDAPAAVQREAVQAIFSLGARTGAE